MLIPSSPRVLRLLAAVAFLAILLSSESFSAMKAGEPGLSPEPALGDPAGSADGDLTDLSIEDLLGLEVTIASRTAQKLSRVPGAVYVLTGDEIRRAGHTSVQEALRMVPGFYVSRWQTSNWDVTSRGFGPGVAYTNEAYINQLLVLLDGVVVYTPLFPGVWWSLQDLDMAQVERIEIIRGPGGILWGSNAVHGVVHIITKDARDTLGPRISARTSEDERHIAASSGIPLGEMGAMRLWIKGARYDALIDPFIGIDDSYGVDSFGARADWTDSSGSEWLAWTRAYEAKVHEIGYDLVNFDPFRALSLKRGYQAHVQRTNPEAGSTFQVSYVSDQQRRPTFFDYRIDTVDVEYRSEVYTGDKLKIQAGGAWRHIQSDFVGDDPTYFDFEPHQVSLDTYRGFGLANYAFNEAWELVGAVSLEHNDLTDWELQPTLRLSWVPDDKTTTWAGVSRAVRTPSLEERYSNETSFLAGDPHFGSEEVVSYELGHRRVLTDELSADVATFYNKYNDLRVEVFGNLGNIVTTNDGEASSYGAEVALDWKPTESWSVRTSYTFDKGDFKYKPTGQDLGTDGQSPKHSGSIRSYWDVCDKWEFDIGIYAVEGLGSFLHEAEYVRSDVRIGYTPSEHFNAYVGIQSLTNGNWTEFSTDIGTRRRSLFFGFDWTP